MRRDVTAQRAPAGRFLRLNRQPLLSPAVQLINAATGAGAALLAARQGQFADIAGFSAGQGLAAFVAVLVGGGTSFVYATGNDAERAAVRLARWRFIAPAIATASAIIGLSYMVTPHPPPLVSVLLGCLSVAIVQLAGLEATTLTREHQMLTWAGTTTISRVVPIVLLGLHIRYSLAVLAGSALMLALYTVCAWPYSRSESSREGLWISLRLAYRPALVLTSALDVLMLRLPIVLAPLALNVTDAGRLVTLISAQQSLTALGTSALYSIMTMRGARSGSREMHRRLERFLVAASLPCSAASAALSTVVLHIFNVTALPNGALVWLLLMCAVPLVTLNRAAQYRMLTRREEKPSALVMAFISIVSSSIALVAVFTRDVVLLAGCSALGELVGTVAVAILARHRRGAAEA